MHHAHCTMHTGCISPEEGLLHGGGGQVLKYLYSTRARVQIEHRQANEGDFSFAKIDTKRHFSVTFHSTCRVEIFKSMQYSLFRKKYMLFRETIQFIYNQRGEKHTL